MTLDSDGAVDVIGTNESSDQIWIDLVADVQYEDGGKETVLCHFCYVGMIGLRVLKLPEQLRTVETDAFSGGKFKRVIIDSNTETVSARAFGKCPALNSIVILGMNTQIGENAFSEDWNDISLIVPAGSCAEEWAKAYGLSYVIAR